MDPPSGSHTRWRGLRKLAGSLGGGTATFGPLKSAVDGLSKCIDLVQEEGQAHKDYERLKNELDSLLADLSEYFDGSTPSPMTPCIEALARDIQREAEELSQSYQSRLGRFANSANLLDEVAECYRRIQGLLGRLVMNVNLNIWKTLDEQATESRLRTLPYSSAARYRSSHSDSLGRTGCIPNTRVDLMQQINDWIQDNTAPRVYWMNVLGSVGGELLLHSAASSVS